MDILSRITELRKQKGWTEYLSRITELRKQKGWTEYELARQAELPQSTVSSWYHKNMLPSVSSLEKICRGFGITMSEFFNEEDAVMLTKEQRELLKRYFSLSESQKEKLNLMMEGMLSKFVPVATKKPKL